MFRYNVEFVSRTPGKSGSGFQAVYAQKEVGPMAIIAKAMEILRSFGHENVFFGPISTEEVPNHHWVPAMTKITIQ
jgi:hypothetical protein